MSQEAHEANANCISFTLACVENKYPEVDLQRCLEEGFPQDKQEELIDGAQELGAKKSYKIRKPIDFPFDCDSDLDIIGFQHGS